MERIELDYTSYKSHVLDSSTKSLQYQHIITTIGSDRYFFLFVPDGDAILYVCYIDEATSQSDVDNYEANYASNANRQIEDRNKSEFYHTSYLNFVNDMKGRNKRYNLSVVTLTDNSYVISFVDGEMTFKYILDHSNTSEKNDFDSNYLGDSNKTLSYHNTHAELKHFVIENKNVTSLWVPKDGLKLHLSSLYFHGYCLASTDKSFGFKIEAKINAQWVQVMGITVKNIDDSFRESITYPMSVNTDKGNGTDAKLRASVIGDVPIGSFSINISITAAEAK